MRPPVPTTGFDAILLFLSLRVQQLLIVFAIMDGLQNGLQGEIVILRYLFRGQRV
jgi:hypothetical protein